MLFNSKVTKSGVEQSYLRLYDYIQISEYKFDIEKPIGFTDHWLLRLQIKQI